MLLNLFRNFIVWDAADILWSEEVWGFSIEKVEWRWSPMAISPCRANMKCNRTFDLRGTFVRESPIYAVVFMRDVNLVHRIKFAFVF